MIKGASIKYIDICLKMCVLNKHISSSGEGCSVFFNPALEFRTREIAMVQEVGRCGGKGMHEDSPISLGLIRSRYVIPCGLN
jgi:hypothetical protein